MVMSMCPGVKAFWELHLHLIKLGKDGSSSSPTVKSVLGLGVGGVTLSLRDGVKSVSWMHQRVDGCGSALTLTCHSRRLVQ